MSMLSTLYREKPNCQIHYANMTNMFNVYTMIRDMDQQKIALTLPDGRALILIKIKLDQSSPQCWNPNCKIKNKYLFKHWENVDHLPAVHIKITHSDWTKTCNRFRNLNEIQKYLLLLFCCFVDFFVLCPLLHLVLPRELPYFKKNYT